MVWFVTGDRSGLVLGVSASGKAICHGTAKHEPIPPGLDEYGDTTDHAILKRIESAGCSWTIVQSTLDEFSMSIRFIDSDKAAHVN